MTDEQKPEEVPNNPQTPGEEVIEDKNIVWSERHDGKEKPGEGPKDKEDKEDKKDK